MVAYQWIHNKIRVCGHQEFTSPLENLYPERPQDVAPFLVGHTAPWSLIMNSRKMRLSVLKQSCKSKTGFCLKTVRDDH